QELCVTLQSEMNGTCTGVLAWNGTLPVDESDSVRWEGDLDCGSGVTKAAAVTLYRDPYAGQCLADVEIEGGDTETAEVETCGDEFGFTIEDYEHSLAVSCAECGTCASTVFCPACQDVPLPRTVFATFEGTGDCACLDGLVLELEWSDRPIFDGEILAPG